MGLKVISHNAQGINSPQKRKKAFRHYKRLGADVILMQETHFATDKHPTFFDKCYSQFYCTTYNTKSRGTAIFVRNSVETQSVYKDPDSQYLILKGSIKGRLVTIASVYAPNEAQSTFFDTLDKFHSTHLIVGGDFNLAAHSALDRSRVVSSSKAFPKALNWLLYNHQLVDTWRAHNVGITVYTFYPHPHDSFARLDYIFYTPILLANSSEAEIHPCPWSDHHIVSFNTTHIGLATTSHNWRINESLPGMSWTP